MMMAFLFGFGSLLAYILLGVYVVRSGSTDKGSADSRSWRIFDLEHELGIGGHNDGYSCMECWRLEDEAAGRTWGKP